MHRESAERPPEGREWRYELKLDGFRAIGRKSGGSAQLWSRNQKDLTRRFRDVVKGIAELANGTRGTTKSCVDERQRNAACCNREDLGQDVYRQQQDYDGQGSVGLSAPTHLNSVPRTQTRSVASVQNRQRLAFQC
jgi:hypothetical protein